MTDEDLPPHDWLLVPLIPLTDREVERLVDGRRFVLKKLDPLDTSMVRGAAVYCARCKIPVDKMTLTERQACRGEDDDPDDYGSLA